jgi:c-di-GMP-binding flagellar brake protein YcgR
MRPAMHNPADRISIIHPGYSGPERRRHVRAPVADDVRLLVHVSVEAQVLDISAGGALVTTASRLQPGERAHLRVLLDREPFSAWVEVRRLQPGTMIASEPRHHMGLSFVALDDASRRTLQRFVKEDVSR